MTLNPLEMRRRRLRRLREERRRKRRARKAARRPAPAPFIVGVNRSGTTLLRMMLDSHPELAIPPETHFVPALFQEIHERKKERPMSAEEVVEFLVAHR